MTFSAHRATGSRRDGHTRVGQSRAGPLRRQRSRFRRAGRWLRKGLAVLCLILAALTALAGKPTAAAPATVPVLLANRDLPVGATLVSTDLRLASWPQPLRPRNAVITMQAAVGTRLVSAIGAGELITTPRLLGVELTGGLPAGLSAAPVALTGRGAAGLVQAGDRVDLLVGGLATTDPLDAPAAGAKTGAGTDAGGADAGGADAGGANAGGAAADIAGARLLADDVQVLAVLPASNDPSSLNPETDVIVAVDRPTALRIASATGLAVVATVRKHQ